MQQDSLSLSINWCMIVADVSWFSHNFPISQNWSKGKFTGNPFQWWQKSLFFRRIFPLTQSVECHIGWFSKPWKPMKIHWKPWNLINIPWKIHWKSHWSTRWSPGRQDSEFHLWRNFATISLQCTQEEMAETPRWCKDPQAGKKTTGWTTANGDMLGIFDGNIPYDSNIF